jgi:hypothetical protein
VWNEVEGGWQWTAGYWAPENADEVPYLPQPPASLDVGPSVPAPDDNSFYNPGCWLYRNERYVWRPGFWVPFQPGWVWTPSSYCWTPRGWVFVEGFWDRPLEDRGVLFAPVVFNRPLWQTPGWAFRPSYAVAPSALTGPLFVGPGAGFWFGNYYGTAWRTAGFRPWFAAPSAGSLYAYYGWRNRANAGWARGLATTFDGRFRGTLPRPTATLVEHNRLLAARSASAAHLRTLPPAASFHTGAAAVHTPAGSAGAVAPRHVEAFRAEHHAAHAPPAAHHRPAPPPSGHRHHR